MNAIEGKVALVTGGSRGIGAAAALRPTDTDANAADGPDADTIRSFTALGHYAEPADIAADIAHLAGDGGRYITGTSLHVDGGFTA